MLANFGTNASGATWWSNFELIQVEPHTMAKFGTNASGAIWWPNLQPMQVVASFATDSSGAIWWPNFELIQVEPHTICQIWNQCFLTGEVTQAKESIPWVRCASGNV